MLKTSGEGSGGESTRYRVYVAILNKGWIRREMFYYLQEMLKTPYLDVYLEPLSKTFASPICSNRNKIRKRFLAAEPKFDWLMMIDDDIFPVQHNPLEILLARKQDLEDKHIIGFPAKVRQTGRNINWVAYLKHPTKEAYGPLDFGQIGSDVDLIKCDVVGTGMILIQRQVLENPNCLFTVTYDDDGICTFGTDFAFCRRATAEGYKVYTTPWKRCEHVKQVGLLDITGYDDSDYSDPVAGNYEMTWGEWSISQSDWRFIGDTIKKYGIENVLEFGAGLSSLLMSEKVKVDTFETDPEHAEAIESKATDRNRLAMHTWAGDDIPVWLEGKRYDMVFVDGPKGIINGGQGRKDSIRIASELADIIIIHDAGRREEMMLQDKYLKGDFKLVASNGQHQSRCHLWERK